MVAMGWRVLAIEPSFAFGTTVRPSSAKELLVSKGTKPCGSYRPSTTSSSSISVIITMFAVRRLQGDTKVDEKRCYAQLVREGGEHRLETDPSLTGGGETESMSRLWGDKDTLRFRLKLCWRPNRGTQEGEACRTTLECRQWCLSRPSCLLAMPGMIDCAGQSERVRDLVGLLLAGLNAM